MEMQTERGKRINCLELPAQKWEIWQSIRSLETGKSGQRSHSEILRKKKEQKPQRKTCNTVFVQERSETKQTKRTIVKPFA